MTPLDFLNLVWPIVVLVVIIALGFSFIAFIAMTILYMPAFLQKKVNLKQAEDILAHNIEIVEKATFFETSEEFNNLIERQKEKIRANAAKIKSQEAQMDQLDKELNKKK